MAEPHFLTDILFLLAAAVVFVPMFQRLGLGSVLGYLAAGAAVGPWGLGFFQEIDDIRYIAEFGVIFLLFIIGIELKPARLWAMRHKVFGLGTLQVVVTGLAITGLALLLDQPLKAALIIGFGLALSSTAFGLQILTERNTFGTAHGQTAFSILLLQDLAVVPLLTMVSLLAVNEPMDEDMEVAVLEALLAIAFVVLAGRYLLSPLLRLVASSRKAEVFTAAALFAVLGTAWLMEEVGLSLALGAFLAGLMLAESSYRHQLVADIQPFRGILLGLFFMAVGMSVDFGLFGRELLLIAGLVIGLLAFKALILWSLCRLTGVAPTDAVRVALLLAQSGEFGFVIFGFAFLSGVLPVELFNLLTLLITMTMVGTPLLAHLGERLARRMSREADGADDISTEHLNGRPTHVIIAGFGRVGRRVSGLLQEADIPYLAIEASAERVLEGRHDDYAVFYGDASQVDVLKAAGAAEAGALVCTLDEPTAAIRLVSILRQHYPEIPILARGRDRAHCAQLRRAGATETISETLESSMQLGAAVLGTMGMLEDDAATLVERKRREYYG